MFNASIIRPVFLYEDPEGGITWFGCPLHDARDRAYSAPDHEAAYPQLHLARRGDG
jgi:hypothetical protein